MSRIVDAYIRLYTRAQMESALRQALEDYATGKTITSISFEGSSTSAALRGAPERIIGVLESALERLDLGYAPPQVVSQNFSCRITES